MSHHNGTFAVRRVRMGLGGCEPDHINSLTPCLHAPTWPLGVTSHAFAPPPHTELSIIATFSMTCLSPQDCHPTAIAQCCLCHLDRFCCLCSCPQPALDNTSHHQRSCICHVSLSLFHSASVVRAVASSPRPHYAVDCHLDTILSPHH